MASAMDFTPFCSEKRYIGRVKWFNNKSGFGFVTVHDTTRLTPYDMFVHHSAIRVKDEQFRYLIQGEYIEFKVTSVEDKAHKYQAADVTGVNEDILMCETRNDCRLQKLEYQKTNKQ